MKPDIGLMEFVHKGTSLCLKASPIGLILSMALPIWRDWDAGRAFDVDNIIYPVAIFGFAAFVLHWMRTSINLAKYREGQGEAEDLW